MAEEMSAYCSRKAMGRARELTKIERPCAPTTRIKGGAAHVCIADPHGRALNISEGSMAELFGTDPPMATRIARLKMMGYEQSANAIPGSAAAPISAPSSAGARAT